MKYKGLTIISSSTGYKCEINPAVIWCTSSLDRMKGLIDGTISLVEANGTISFNPKLLEKHILINQKIRG